MILPLFFQTDPKIAIYCVYLPLENLNIMNEKIIKDAAALSNALVDKVDHFLHHFTSYATDLEVGIHPETFDIILDSPSKIPDSYRRHSIADFILTNEKGLYEPDEKAILQVAEHYF